MATITGSSGNDTYTGSAAAADTADIVASQSSAVFSFNGAVWSVASAAGTDSLSSIEAVQFSDALFTLGTGGENPVGSTGFQSLSAVANLTGGGSVVVWQAGGVDGGGTGVFAQRYDAGGQKLGSATRVNTTVANDQGRPAIAPLTDGGYVVAWMSALQDGSGQGVYLQRYTAAGAAAGAETRISTTTANDQTAPVLRALPGGGFVAVWQSMLQDGDGAGIFLQRFDATGAASGTETRVNSNVVGDQVGPSVAVLASGVTVVSWTSVGQDGSGSGVYLQRFDATGARLGVETLVNTSTTGYQLEPDVVALGGGGFAVVWQSVGQDGSGSGVYMQRYTAAGAVAGVETRVNTITAGDQANAAVASLSDGGFVVAWQSFGQDGADLGIVAQRFNASGAAVGGEILVNAVTAGAQANPAVTGLAGGGFLVTWDSRNTDGTQSTVRSQQFAADGTPSVSGIQGDATDNVIRLGGSAPYALSGLGGNDSLVGAAGRDLLDGGAGNDTLDGGAGADTLKGGAGNDSYVVDVAGDVVQESATAGEIDTVRTAITLTLAANVEQLVLTGSAAVNGTGNALDNTLTGNGAANVLSGAGGNDSLDGGAGNDSLDGGAGNDSLAGGTGNDTYEVDSATDVVTETSTVAGEIDTVRAAVSFTLGANLETLVLTGSAAINGTGNGLANAITGNVGANSLDGGAGADTLDGGAGSDSLSGGTGNDVYVVDASGDTVTETPTTASEIDTVRASVSFTLGANLENLTLTGTGVINGTGNALANRLVGNDAANVLTGAAGADTLTGGLGNDIYVVDSTDVVVEGAGGGLDTIRTGTSYTLSGRFVENLELTGSARANLFGNGLDNTLTGNGADNILDGGAGRDTLIGGAGGDTYVVDTTQDVVVEVAGGGRDTVLSLGSFVLPVEVEILRLTGGGDVNGSGNALDNLIAGNRGANRLDGGAGADTLSGGMGNDTYVIDAGDRVVEFADEGIDGIVVNADWTLDDDLEDLTLAGTGNWSGTGNEADNRLFGNGGDNLLDGKYGADTLNGGLGNDTYRVDDPADQAFEDTDPEASLDVVEATADHTLGDGMENLLLQGPDGLVGTGNDDDNLITGTAANDTIEGGDGFDTVAGGAGDDVYRVDGLSDEVLENPGEGVDTVWSLTAFAYTLEPNVENLRLASDTTIQAIGNELDNQLFGWGDDPGLVVDNLLDGGAGADVMAGGKGDDQYVVDDSADAILEQSGAGIDSVLASVDYVLPVHVERLVLADTQPITGTGNALGNRITGNSVDNLVTALGGNDLVWGGAGNDTLLGGDDHDTLVGGAGNDSLEGGAGSDWVDYRSVVAALTINLSAGFPLTVVANGTDTLLDVENLMGSLTGADTLTGSAADNALYGYGGADVLTGGAGNDDLRGFAGADTLDGGDNDDTLNGGAGSDSLAGGAGTDTADFGGVQSGVVASLVTGAASQDGFGGADTLSGFENLAGGSYRDLLTGDGQANRLWGRNGIDTLLGGAGDDTIDGGSGRDSVVGDLGNDSLIGGGGNDVLSAGDGLDTLNGGSGDDSLDGSFGDDLLVGGAGNDTLRGDAGSDLVDFGGATGDVVVDLNQPLEVLDGLGGTDVLIDVESVASGAGDDTLVGDAFGNLLQGRDGDDELTGNGGDDTLEGGAGNDALDGGQGLDVLSGGEGDDELSGTDGEDSLDGGAGHDSLHGGSGLDQLAGADGDDVLFGNDGGDAMDGGAGNDTLDGGLEDDVLQGGDGNDEIAGGVGLDTLSGGGGGDSLQGDTGTDRLEGGSGKDTLRGGLDLDTLVGGLGQDEFWFTNASETGATPASADVIDDFTQGEDVIVFGGQFVADSTSLSPNNLFAFIGSGAFSAPGQIRYEVDGSDLVVYGNTDANSLDAEFAILLTARSGIVLDSLDFGLSAAP